MRHKKLMVLCFFFKKIPNTLVYSFQKYNRKNKKKKNVIYAFKWYFYGFLYNTTLPLVKIYI